jgi:hypothetical protein
MQGKLEIHRLQMEAQLGISIGSTSGSPFTSQGISTPKVPIARVRKSKRKEQSQPRKKRKTNSIQSNTIDTEMRDAPSDPNAGMEGENGDITRNDGEGSSSSTVAEEMDVEQEFNDAFDELFDSI